MTNAVEDIRGIKHKGSRLSAMRQGIEGTPSLVREFELSELDDLHKYVQDERRRLWELAMLANPPLKKENIPDLYRLDWLEAAIGEEKERRKQLEGRVIPQPQISGPALPEQDEPEYFRQVFLNPEQDIPFLLEAFSRLDFIDENQVWRVAQYPNPLGPIMALIHYPRHSFFHNLPRVQIERAFCERFTIKRPQKGFEPKNKPFELAKTMMHNYLKRPVKIADNSDKLPTEPRQG